MATATGPRPDSLTSFLCETDCHGDERFHKFDFFRLVRLFELTRGDLPRVGCARIPAQEALRFGQKPYQGFASSTFQGLDVEPGKPPKLFVAFMGMFGPCGALPQCHTEFAIHRGAIQRREQISRWNTPTMGLRLTDFADLPGFIRRLRKREDAVARALWEALPVSVRQKLQDLTPGSFLTPPLRDEFIEHLSEAIAGVDLISSIREAGMAVPEEIETSFLDKPLGPDLARLNRSLLGLAFNREMNSARRLTATPWDLAPWDFGDLAGFVRQCREGADPFSRCLRDHLPMRIRQVLKDFPPGSFLVEPLLGDLIRSLNELMVAVDLHQVGACAGMELPPDIEHLVDTRPSGAVLARLNRQLIALAFQGRVSHLQENRNRDETLSRFVDIFHHRMISYFYRAWAIHQKSVDLDRPDIPQIDQRQKFPLYLGSLAGIGMDSLRGRDNLKDFDRAYYSGYLSAQPRNAASFQALVQDYYDIPTKIIPFCGRWIDLPPENVSQLGLTADTGSLGSTTIIGSKIWDCSMAFRIRMGPMGIEDFERMLPKKEIICSRCRQPLEPVSRQQKLLDRLPEGVTHLLSEGGGCAHCRYVGPEDWDWEVSGYDAFGGRMVVCKKCRAPFGPAQLQTELQKLPLEEISKRLAKSEGCAECKANRASGWQVVGAGAFERLKTWVRTYFGYQYVWDLQLVLRKGDVPEVRLGESGKLGHTTWIKTKPTLKNSDEMIIQTN